MNKSKKPLPLLLALLAMGLASCGGGGSSSVAPISFSSSSQAPAPSSSATSSSSKGEETSSQTSSVDTDSISQSTWDTFLKDSALYKRADFDAKLSFDDHERLPLFTITRDGKKFGLSDPQYPFARYIQLEKTPESLEQEVDGKKYEHVYSLRYDGYYEYDLTTSIAAILGENGFPLLNLPYASFRQVPSEGDDLIYEGEDIELKIGERTFHSKVTVGWSFYASESGDTPMVSSIRFQDEETHYLLGLNLKNQRVTLPSEYRVYEDFTFALNEDKKSYTLLYSTVDEYVVEVPSTYNGLPVTTIGQNAFYGNKNIIQLILPDSVTTIIGELGVYVEEIVTKNCESNYHENAIVRSLAESRISFREDGFIAKGDKLLAFNKPEQTSVTLPDGFTTIPVIKGLKMATEVIVPEGYIYLYSNALGYWENATSISLPDSLSECRWESRGLLYPDNVTPNEKDGFLYLGNANNPYVLCVGAKEGTSFAELEVLTFAPTCRILPFRNIQIPEEDRHYSEVIIPASVREFTSFEAVVADSITKLTCLGGWAGELQDASECPNITEIVIAGNAHGSFSCRSFPKLTTLTIGTYLEGLDCMYHEALTTLILEDGARVSEQCFRNCAKLENLFLKTDAICIDPTAFMNTPILPTRLEGGLYFGTEDNPYAVLVEADLSPSDTSYAVHAGVKTICKGALKSDVEGFEVLLPEGLKVLDESWLAMEDGTRRNLSFSVPSLPTSLEYIGPDAFRKAEFAMAEITLPETLKDIRSNAFASSNITKLTIPFGSDRFNEEHYGFFLGCEKLETVDFLVPFEKFYAKMWSSCTSLTMNKLPEGLKFLGESCLVGVQRNNYGIPDGVERIESKIYSSTTLSYPVRIPASVSYMDPDAFPGYKLIIDPENPYYAVDENNSLYDAGFTILYRLDKGTGGDIVLPDTLVEIKPEAIQRTEVTSITGGKNLRSIGHRAIQYNDRLLSVDFSATSIDKLDESCISRNYALGTALLPDTLRFIGSYALEENRITKLVIPEGVRGINRNAFASNPLYRLELPSTLEKDKISEDAFNINNNTEVLYSGDLDLTPFFQGSTLPHLIGSESDSRLENKDGGFITYTDIGGNVHLVDVISEEETIVIPDYVNGIGPNAFAHLKNMKRLVIPASVKAINAHCILDTLYNDITLEYGGDLNAFRQAIDRGANEGYSLGYYPWSTDFNMVYVNGSGKTITFEYGA